MGSTSTPLRSKKIPREPDFEGYFTGMALGSVEYDNLEFEMPIG